MPRIEVIAPAMECLGRPAQIASRLQTTDMKQASEKEGVWAEDQKTWQHMHYFCNVQEVRESEKVAQLAPEVQRSKSLRAGRGNEQSRRSSQLPAEVGMKMRSRCSFFQLLPSLCLSFLFTSGIPAESGWPQGTQRLRGGAREDAGIIWHLAVSLH